MIATRRERWEEGGREGERERERSKAAVVTTPP